MKDTEQGKNSQVVEQLNSLNQILSELAESISVLQERLQPILRCDNESNDPSDEVEPRKLVPLADEIRQHRHYVEILMDRIRKLQDIMEL